MKRYWINAPSTLQPEHKFHGMQVLGPQQLSNDTVTVYPNSGSIISMRVFTNSLSPYWRGHDNLD